MRRALPIYLKALWRSGDPAAAALSSAEAVADRPWEVVRDAGLLARCAVGVAEADLGLTAQLRTCRPDASGVVARVPAGAPLPVPRHSGRRARGAFDTPVEMARRVVQQAARACEGEARTALDPSCGTGAFLLALHELGVPEIHGTDLDPLALEVARVAVPRARLAQADALAHGAQVDLVVGNPPFVPPERQDKEMRKVLQRRFPWLRGRFDLAVPFAAAAVARARPGGAVGLVLPAPALVQPYGEVLRRRWLERHRLVEIAGPQPFPAAQVEVALVVLVAERGPAPVPAYGVAAQDVLRLPAAPLNPDLRPGDVDLVARVRQASVPLGELALVDTGVVAHGPAGSRERLLHDRPGPGRVPYADARDFFSGRRRWLDWRPDQMHRPKLRLPFESPKLVIQRVRGRGPVRAAIDRDGTRVGHTCTVVFPLGDLPLERLLELVRSPLVDGLVRIERGTRLDLYPRDVASFPVPRAWLEHPELPLDKAWALGEAEVARLVSLAG